MGEILISKRILRSSPRTLRFIRFLQLHFGDNSLLMNMYPEQFAYGHREILLDECELDYSAQLIGNLQHGIEINSFDFRSPKYLFGKTAKTWVFSRDLEIESRKQGFKNVYAIGAPWLYLARRNTSKLIFTGNMTKRVLVMPGHSQTNFYDRSSKDLMIKRAKLFRDAVGNLQSTLCLHPIDFLNADTRNSFAEQGFEVVCLGISNSIPPWSPAANRMKFLDNLFYLMSTHTHYVTDDVGTSLFYALNMGLEVAVFPEIRHSLDTAGINSGAINNSEYLNSSEKFLKQNLNEVIDRFGASDQLRNFANLSLGLDCMKEKEELLEILDFRRDVYTDFQFHS